MLKQTKEVMDALEFKFPHVQFLHQFDWSAGHAKYPKGAPNVHNMNVGKQGVFRAAQILQDFDYTPEFPLIKLRTNMFQEMVFREGDPAPIYKPNLQPENMKTKQKA